MLIIKIKDVDRLSPAEEGFLSVGIENILDENERDHGYIDFIYQDED
jgi:hypothetical protein